MSAAACFMAERFDRRTVRDWVQSVEEARRSCIPEPSEDYDWGLSSNPDIQYATPAQRQNHPPAASQTQAFASSTKVLSEANVNVQVPPAHPPVFKLREKSQSPLPEPTRSPELPPFDLIGISEEHPKALFKRALTYGGVSSPSMPRSGSPNLLRACTSPDLLYQAKSAPTSPNLSLHSRRPVAPKKGGRGPLQSLILCRSSSETNLANVNINISLASSAEGFGSSSLRSGELASDRGSSHYNVSPVHSDDEMGGGYDDDIVDAAMPLLGSSGQTSGKRRGQSHGGGEGGSPDLPPLRQEELAVVSMSIGGQLPHLTLLLGMEYEEYEHVASDAGSSQETQALKLLMRWYRSGRGDRWVLAEALKMAGHSRIAKLLLQDELETVFEDRDQLSMLRATPLSPSPPPRPSRSPRTLSPPSPVTTHAHPVTSQQGRGISKLQLQKLEKMHTRSFAFEEDENNWARPDSKHQKFLSKRSTSAASISPSHPSYLLPRHTLLEHGGSQDFSSTRPTGRCQSSRGSLPLWGSNPSQMRLEKLQNFHSSTEELKLAAQSSSRGSVTPVSPTFQQLPKPSSVQPPPEPEVACELTTTALRFPSQLQTGTGKMAFKKSWSPWQQHEQQEQISELQERPGKKDHVSRQDSGIGTLSSTSRYDFRY